MAKATADQYTTTAQQDAVLAAYGEDLAAQVTLECGRCGGRGVIEAFRYTEGGVCFECNGRPELARRYTTVGHLLANARKRDLAAANRDRKAAAKADAMNAWKAENSALLARAEAVNVTWWTNWREAPSAEDMAKVVAEVERREAEDARRAAVKATAAPVQAGRVRITGRVVSWKEVPNNFSYHGGYITKILVEDDRGFRVFGTLSAELSTAVRGAWLGTVEDRHDYGPTYWMEHFLKGARVTFAATTEPSKDDPTFGFFTRPTKAEYLGRAEG